MVELQRWLDSLYIHYTIEQLTSLTLLDLSNRGLTELHPNIGKLTKLESLWCENNNLTKIELDWSNIKGLYCHKNKLTKLSLNCHHLIDLACSYNQLTKLDLNCANLKQLISEGNPFKVIKDSKLHKLLDLHNEPYVLMEESKMGSIL